MFGIFKSKSKANNIEEHNIDFDAKLKEAVIKSNGYEIKYCIENGANPNIIHNGSSLLCYMVFSNSSEMVELCLKHGAIATIKNLKYIDDSEIEGEFNRNGFEFYRDKTPIEIAIHKDYIEILHIFIKYKVVDKQLKNWIDKRLFISILDKDISNIEYYLQHGANIYEEIYTNFSVFGLSDPYYDKLKNYDMSSSLSLILEKKDKKIIKSILKYDSTSSELYKWLSTQSNNNVEEFIEYGVDINNLIAHSIIQNDIKMECPL